MKTRPTDEAAKENRKAALEDENPFSAVKVWFDADYIYLQLPERKLRKLPWDSIMAVAIETTDQGPFLEDLWWHIAGRDIVLTYPNQAEGAETMAERLQELPSFGNAAMIEAMSCAENRVFLLSDIEGRHL